MKKTNEIASESFTEGVAAPLVNFQPTFEKSKENLNFNTSNLNVVKKNSKLDAKTKLTTFLNQFRVGKGQEYTHTSMGRGAGSYFIPLEYKAKLIDLLYETIFVELKPIHLTEKPPQHTLIKVDLDFKYPLERPNRTYTIADIAEIVNLYNQAIKHYLEISDNQLIVCVFERNQPYVKDNIIKDGLHLMYPEIICDTKIQHLIRQHVLLNCQPILSRLGCLNNYDDIIDKSIISTNNWLMYGCSKPGIEPYTLTHIYDSGLNGFEFDGDAKQLINILSIRDHDQSQSVKIRDEHKYLIEPKVRGNQSAKKAEEKPEFSKIRSKKIGAIGMSNYTSEGVEYNIEELKQLSNMFSQKRVDDRKSWIEIGLALHHTNPEDQQLLDLWIEISKGSEKYKEGECSREWSGMKLKSNGLTFRSFHRWAQEDHPEEYFEYIKEKKTSDLCMLILRSQSQTTSDVANVVHCLLKNQFVYVPCQKDKGWYMFDNHRWAVDPEALSLKRIIKTQIISEYLRLITYYNEKGYELKDLDSEEGNKYLQKAKNLTDVTYKLRDKTFINNLIESCRENFYDKNLNFLEVLDSNPDILGFNNGVYDFKEGKFRDGKPEDYITKSTQLDFKVCRIEDVKVQIVVNFIRSIILKDNTEKVFNDLTQTLENKLVRPITDEDLVEKLLMYLSYCLTGHNYLTYFLILVGSGGNGKTLLANLLFDCLGDYYDSIPTTYLTQKMGDPNAPNPTEAGLKGIRVGCMDEADESKGIPTLNGGIVKSKTGNTRITKGRFLYGGIIKFQPQYKLMFLTNVFPHIPDAESDAMVRRVRAIEFKAAFKSESLLDPNNPNHFPMDKNLENDLKDCKAEFIWLLTQYYEKFRAIKNFDFPKSTVEFMKNSAKKSNPYSDFIESCLEKRPGFGIKKQELWDQYIEYNKGKIPNITQLKFHKIISEVLGSPVKNPNLSKEYFNTIGISYPLYGKLTANGVYKDWYFYLDGEESKDQNFQDNFLQDD